MYLSELTAKQTAIIIAIDLPVHEKQRLASLGLIQGSVLYILRNNRNASLLIEYRDTFLAISYELAQHISITTPQTSPSEGISA